VFWLAYRCRKYATDFADAFLRVGWNDAVDISWDQHHGLTGIRLHVENTDSPPATARVLESALRQINVKSELRAHRDMELQRTVFWVYRRE
jgi:hypothetical protein